MKITDITLGGSCLIPRSLLEAPVDSSWITSLSQTRQGRADKIVTMRTKGKDNVNREYEIFPMSRTRFEQWRDSPSQGDFWHQNVKGKYHIRRIVKPPVGITYPEFNG